MPTTLAERMLDITTIYHEPDIEAHPRAVEILERFPRAQRIEVPSHQDIPGLYGNQGSVSDWVRNKREILALGEKKSLWRRPNGRSSDFIAPSASNGCAMACSYCYVPRRKGYANPIVSGGIKVHQFRQFNGSIFSQMRRSRHTLSDSAHSVRPTVSWGRLHAERTGI